jgi:hypothetical protein
MLRSITKTITIHKFKGGTEMKKIKKYHFFQAGGLLFLTLISSVLAFAQVPFDLTKIVEGNKKALQQYSWLMRTEVQLAGKPQIIKLEKSRFDIDSRFQKTPISVWQSDQKPTNAFPKMFYEEKHCGLKRSE